MCDTRADSHMIGDISLLSTLEEIPSNLCVKQIKEKVPTRKWGVVHVSTYIGDEAMRDLELREVLYVLGIRADIFSL